MKNKSQLIIALLIALFAMTGCPYESPVPLSDSCSSVIDTTLTGKWIFKSGKNPRDTILFMKFNDHEYYIAFIGDGKSDINITSGGRAFITKLGNQNIINLTEIGHPEKVYLSRYETRDNMMILSSASDNFIRQPINSTDELRDFYLKNMNKAGFYETSDTLIR